MYARQLLYNPDDRLMESLQEEYERRFVLRGGCTTRNSKPDERRPGRNSRLLYALELVFTTPANHDPARCQLPAPEPARWRRPNDCAGGTRLDMIRSLQAVAGGIAPRESVVPVCRQCRRPR